MQLLQILLKSTGTSSTTTMIMRGGRIFVFYFFLIHPKQKKDNEQKSFITGLQKGDKIVTIAGIHGTVNKVNDDATLLLETSPGSYIKIERSAISMEWTANINKPVVEAKK